MIRLLPLVAIILIIAPCQAVSSQDTIRKASALIMKFEKFSEKPYKDVAGVRTIGYGFTGPIAERSSITKGEALVELNRIIVHIDEDVIVNESLTINQRAALISFIYNVGEAAYKKSTLKKHLDLGDKKAASRQFSRWNKVCSPTCKSIKGLSRRRNEEQRLFNKMEEK